MFGKTKQAVQDKLKKLASEVTHLQGVDPQRIKLGDYLDRWLRDAAKARVAAKAAE